MRLRHHHHLGRAAAASATRDRHSGHRAIGFSKIEMLRMGVLVMAIMSAVTFQICFSNQETACVRNQKLDTQTIISMAKAASIQSRQ